LRQLPAVRVLVKSFADHNPGAPLPRRCSSTATPSPKLTPLDRFADGARFVHPTALGIGGDEGLARFAHGVTRRTEPPARCLRARA